MEEIFPVGSGVVLGLVVAYLIPARHRGWVLGVFSVLLGAAAAWVSGELAVSGVYLLIDVAQVLVAAALSSILAARWGPLRRPASPRDA